MERVTRSWRARMMLGGWVSLRRPPTATKLGLPGTPGYSAFQSYGVRSSPSISLCCQCLEFEPKGNAVGVYTEYLDRQMEFQEIAVERQKQLQRISQIRGRDILVIAADLSKNAPTAMAYSDLLPIADQLSNLKGSHAIDVILETPGGSGEVAEDIVRQLHSRYKEVGIIIPGWAKSAGTIIAMAGDEILMGSSSALGPIDAQISWQGKAFSADALIEGMEKIKREVERTNVLNKTYIPMLQGISPGELQSAENALKFAKVLVTDWLAKYKFKGWTHHSSTGKPVTEQDRRARAEEIAETLCDHRRWLTHGRSLQIADLETMRLKITNYTTIPDLSDAITRYYTLLHMAFVTNCYKLFETPTSVIYRFVAQQSAPVPQAASADVAFLDTTCRKCGTSARIQANLGKTSPLQAGFVPFPADNKFRCSNCGTESDISGARRNVEAQAKKAIVP